MLQAINSQRFYLFALLICAILVMSCDNDDDSNPSQTPAFSPSLDTQLQSVIRVQGLSGDPTIGRLIPDINTPLAQLGKKLFFSKSLSGNLDTACVSCHHPTLGGGDGLSLSIGTSAILPDHLGPGRTHASTALHFDGGPTVPRNAPTTFNVVLWDQVMFHDGRVESLGKTPNANGNDGQGIRTPDSKLDVADPQAGVDLATAQLRFPVTSPEEMRGFTFEKDNSNESVRKALVRRLVEQSIPNFWELEFQQAFESNDDASTLVTFTHIAKATFFLNGSGPVYLTFPITIPSVILETQILVNDISISLSIIVNGWSLWSILGLPFSFTRIT